MNVAPKIGPRHFRPRSLEAKTRVRASASGAAARTGGSTNISARTLAGLVLRPSVVGQTAGGLFGPGRRSDDTFVPQRCEQAPANRCVDQCVAEGLGSSQRPYYNLFSSLGLKLGKNCQDWANDLLEYCQDQCAGSGPFSSGGG